MGRAVLAMCAVGLAGGAAAAAALFLKVRCQQLWVCSVENLSNVVIRDVTGIHECDHMIQTTSGKVDKLTTAA
jgi:hypothetical protein